MRITLWVKGNFADAQHSCDMFNVKVYSKVSTAVLDAWNLIQVEAEADPTDIARWMAADELSKRENGPAYPFGALLFFRWEEVTEQEAKMVLAEELMK